MHLPAPIQHISPAGTDLVYHKSIRVSRGLLKLFSLDNWGYPMVYCYHSPRYGDTVPSMPTPPLCIRQRRSEVFVVPSFSEHDFGHDVQRTGRCNHGARPAYSHHPVSHGRMGQRCSAQGMWPRLRRHSPWGEHQRRVTGMFSTTRSITPAIPTKTALTKRFLFAQSKS